MTAIGIVLCSILLVVPGVLVALRWFVAIQARAIEGSGASKALARSGELTQGHRWKLLGLALVYAVAALLLYGLPIALIESRQPNITLAGVNIAPMLLTLLPAMIFGALINVGTAVTYTELRRVKEGGLTAQVAAVFE